MRAGGAGNTPLDGAGEPVAGTRLVNDVTNDGQRLLLALGD